MRTFTPIHYALVSEIVPNCCKSRQTAHLRWRLARAALFVSVVSPLAHGCPHDENLVFKLRAGFARQQVQLQGNNVGQVKRTVFSRYEKRGCFAAGSPEYFGE